MAEKEEEKHTTKSEVALREEAVLEFWQKNKIFEKSLEKEAPKGNYVFYDGPPFATGVPHYGHILGSTVKDVIGRYQTMRGFRVLRRWGWDCHGLPIENIVEQDLKISGKAAIEELGIANFTEHARSKVLTYVSEWKKTIDRMGRWVDFDNSYKTMDNTFIESVWWALSELNKKNLLYESVRVLAYCPRCETPIANSEIAMDNSYKDITDISVYVKFELKDDGKSPSTSSGRVDMCTYLLAWTTTPWTLPGNTAIAVNENLSYLFVKNSTESGEEILIVAKDRFTVLENKFKNPEIVKEVFGSELVGRSYKPVFDYYKNVDMPNKENIWKIWSADFVTVEMGTGVAHEAPAFGEEDMKLAKTRHIPFIRHVDPNGVFAKEVTDFAGIKVKPKEDHQSADVLIIKYLARENKLFAKEKIIHSYPHCYRCETPLLYYALPSWFVNITKIKSELLKRAKEINWIPSHLKRGRFNNILENAPDWTISRNRYWASPLPIWKSELGKTMFVNSLADLRAKTKKSGNKYFVARHGEANSNVNGVADSSGDKQNKLTEKGVKDIKNSAEAHKDIGFDFIFCSPMGRTKETASIIADTTGYDKDKIIFDERLLEFQLGDLDGKNVAEYHKYMKTVPDYFSSPLPNGESRLAVHKRMGDFIYELEQKYSNKKILIVSHGDPVLALFLVVQGYNKNKIKEEENGFKYFQTGEIRELNFVPIPHNDTYELDFHRPYIDAITLVDENGEEYERIPEVVDCWFESGSMPFAQDHYPFENPDWRKNNFPAGFVAEYIAQTRTWFYYTHVISSILFKQAPFRNVVTTGTLLAEDGSKMSKSKNNFPDPSILFDKYGVDALRLYLMSSPLMKGEDANFSEKSVQEISSKIIGRLFNVLAFYELYPISEEILHDRGDNMPKSNNVLDKWILARFYQTRHEMTKGMENYDMAEATRPIDLFIEDLSTWYLRRSRERIKVGDEDAKTTLYFILKTMAKVLAPFAPFTAEDIWQKLKREEDPQSVHLANWPKTPGGFLGVWDGGRFKIFSFLKPKVLEKMATVRDIVTLGLDARQKAGIKVRQPLGRVEIIAEKLSDDYIEIIKDELNIKKIDYTVHVKIGLNKVKLDTNITPELKQEGDYRELARALQDIRKQLGLTPSDVVKLTLETNEEGKEFIRKFEHDLKKTVLISEIEFKDNDSPEIKIASLVFKAKINKA
ncbi:MAG: class I tRNA ligase family protein [Candidatus Paceibacterota bacterium]